MDLTLPFDSEADLLESSNVNFTVFGGPIEEPKPPLQGSSSVLFYFASACCILFMCVGIPGNLITIFALARCKKVRNATAIFIINLSLADLLFCCFNLPLAASTFYHRKWIHSELLCQLFPLLRYGLMAVSLFTIMTITINRYIMISHPRAYPRIYRRKYLITMIALTWMCAFGSLIQTWRGRWGRFGWDTHVRSCSILPSNGTSPKEFLFAMAFALPCLAIVLCYARIFYIVRKTAMKTQDVQIKANGSVRIGRGANSNKSSAKGSSNPDKHAPNAVGENSKLNKKTRPSVSDNSESDKTNDTHSLRSRPSVDSSSDQRPNTKKFLSKIKPDDLKFIDTSVESDLPPTLSQLQRKSVQISFDSSPSTPPAVHTIENDAANSFNSLGNSNGIEAANTHKDELNNDLSARETSSTSGVETQCDKKVLQKKSNRGGSKTKIKQRKLKEESPPKDMTRKKSLANTSGASILLAGRMSAKDRRLLKMILVIFLSFLTCYLPITLTKVFKSIANVELVYIMGYVLVYLTTCINPIIYVVMSSEYRQAYKNLLMCRAGKGNDKFTSTRRRL